MTLQAYQSASAIASRSFRSLWKEVKAMASGEMTNATYNQHVDRTDAVKYVGNVLTVRAGYLSVEPLCTRLDTILRRDARAIFDNQNLVIQYTDGNGLTMEPPPEEPPEEEVELETEAVPETPPEPIEQAPTEALPADEENSPTGIGFTSLKSNFTAVPNVYFDQLIANANISPVTIRFIAAVMRNTIGILDSKGNRREWWENLTLPDIGEAAGIKSINGVKKARKEAINTGWVKYRQSEQRPGQALDLAIRYEWEPVCEI